MYLCNPFAKKVRLDFFLIFFFKKFVGIKKSFTFAAASEEKQKKSLKRSFRRQSKNTGKAFKVPSNKVAILGNWSLNDEY